MKQGKTVGSVLLTPFVYVYLFSIEYAMQALETWQMIRSRYIRRIPETISPVGEYDSL